MFRCSALCDARLNSETERIGLHCPIFTHQRPEKSMSRTFTKSDLAKHTSRGDCYILLHGHVFDISSFMETHPGGWEILVKNAKEGFDNAEEFESIKHSEDARTLAQSFLIGKLEGTTNSFPMSFKMRPSMVDNIRTPPPKEVGDPSNPFLVGAIVVGLAYGAYHVLTKKRG